MRFIVTDRLGAYRFDLSLVMSAVRTRNVDGTDQLEISFLSQEVEKDDRVLVRMPTGEWREYQVVSTAVSRGKQMGGMTALCRNSIAELSRKYVVEREGRGYTAGQALEKALDGTRWEAGTVGVAASVTANVSFYHQSALEAVTGLCSAYGCELDATVEVSGNAVSRRLVHLPLRIGSSSPKRFEYGRDLASVKRTVSADDVITRLYGWGKGVELTDSEGNATGGYSRKISFADVNGGKAYVEDAEATKRFGIPGPDGTLLPCEGSYENGDIDDPEELLAATKVELAERSKPKVTYECDVVSLEQAGMGADGVAAGDTVHIVDTCFSPPLRLEGRVLEVVEPLVGPRTDAKVTLGNVKRSLSDRMEDPSPAVKKLIDQSSSWNSAAGLDTSYLDGILSGLNQVLNETGGYTYLEAGKGIFVYDKPKDQSPTQVIHIGGGYWRCANRKDSSGEWVWRTVATGAGVVADSVTTGTLDAALIRAGLLTDKKGSNYWNLDTGEFKLSAGASVGGKDIATTDSAVKSVDVEYAQSSSSSQAPTSGWQTLAPAWKAGMYIWQRTKTVMQSGSVSYSQAVCISGRNGIDGAPGEAGADGKDGTPGKDGKDASPIYFHRAYAKSADGKQGFSTTYVAGCKYFGTYVDNTVADSTDPSKYDWALFVGKDGADGIPGTNGADGTTYYLHIAYATSSDGKQGFSVDDPAGKTYIGQCVDTSKPDPKTPASYSWSLIKGADGEDGIGIEGVEEQYYLSTSNTACSGGKWSASQPSYVKGRYYWTRSKVTWSDGAVTYTDPELAQGINNANEKATAADDLANELSDSLKTLDKTIDDLAADGVVTEAEKAAVAKVMQQIAKERADAVADYRSMSGHAALDSTGGGTVSASTTPGTLLRSAFFAAFGNPAEDAPTGGAYAALRDAIDDVCDCTTADALSSAVDAYKEKYSAYANKANAYFSQSRTCHSLVEQYKAAAATDSMLTQEEVFNRLTSNGAIQGIYMENGKLFVNATYIKSGVIGDGKGNNYWNMESGFLTATSGRIGGLTLASSKMYSGKSTLTSNTYGTYVGQDGFATGSGSAYAALSRGYLFGGDAEEPTGYVGFRNYETKTNIQGTRLAGKGCICLLTDDWIGVSPYKKDTEAITCTTGKSGTVKVITNLSASWTRMSLTGSYNVSNLCQNLSMNWTYKTLTFDHGLMATAL